MNWKLIDKSKSPIPAGNSHKDTRWKDVLAKEGHYQCVYCATPDSYMGGIRIYEIEHYQPASKFAHLKNVMSNLFYACPICNGFKSDDWPADPLGDHSIPAYPNPSVVDYSTIFDATNLKGIIKGQNPAAKYLIVQLFLNRPQLITLRRYILLKERHRQITKRINQLLAKIAIADTNTKTTIGEKILTLTEKLNKIQIIRDKLENARLYIRKDVTKPTKPTKPLKKT